MISWSSRKSEPIETNAAGGPREEGSKTDLAFLAKTALDFAEFAPSKNIYSYIAEQLRSYIGNCIVGFSTFDDATDTITTRALAGLGDLTDKLMAIIGKNPVGATYKLNADAKKGLPTGKLTRLPGKLYELTFGQFSQQACKAVEQLFGINEVYAVGFIKKGKVYGAASLILRGEAELKNPEVIEVFIEQASLTLDRLQAERVLRESEEKLRDLFENSNDIITYVDPRGKMLDVNQRIKDILGYSPEEIVGKNFADLGILQLKDAPQIVKLFAETIMKGEAKTILELELKHKNGSGVFMEVGTRFIKSNGQIKGVINSFRDITERKRGGHLLRESEEKFRAIFDNAGDGILLADGETRKFFLGNKAICRMLGYSPEEIKELVVMDLIPEKDAPYVIDQFERQAKGEFTSSRDLPVKRKDGSVFYADINSTAVTIAGKAYLMGFFHDTSERKRTEEEILLKSTLLEAQSETAIDGILAIDDNGKSILFNQHFGEMWKIPQEILDARNDEKMLQHVMGQLKNPEEFIDKVKYLYAHREEKSRDEIEFKDGRFFDRYSSPLTSMNGKYYGRIWYFRDITERKQAESVLRKSEAMYSALVETTDTGYVVIDTEGKVVDANAEYVRLTGHRDLNEIRGRSVVEWTADYEKEKNAVAVAQCAKDGYIKNLEIDYIDKQGKITPIEINATVVEREGIPQILTLCRDITERKKAEEALKARALELEKLNQVMVGRELKMIELKEELAKLKGKNEAQ